MIATTPNNTTAVSSPLPHPSMMQQTQVPVGPAGPTSITRYMMAQSPQGATYRPPISPMNTISMKNQEQNSSIELKTSVISDLGYGNSPAAIMDDEIQFLVKFFTERIQYLPRMIVRCQQEGTDPSTFFVS